jgi:hypothetical protein
LYRTLERLLKTIGEAMQADGISRADIDAYFNAPPMGWEKGPDSTAPLPPADATGPSTGLRAGQERKGASWRQTR